MRAILSVATLTLIAVLSLPFAAAGQAADPWLGTWKLDLTRSKRPGTPVKSQILRIESMADGAQKHAFETIEANGETSGSERVARFDEKEVPVAGGVPSADARTNKFRRIDDHSFEVVAMRNGSVTATTRAVVSADGKTMTQTQTSTNPQGETVTSISVYTKQ